MWCELVSEFSRLAELSPDWSRLVRQSPSASIFQTWEWASAFWKAYGRSSCLCTIAIYDEGRTVGLLPLVRKDGIIQFLGAPDSDYNDLLCEEGAEGAVLEAALGYLHRSSLPWQSMTLEKIPARSRFFKAIESLPSSLRAHLQVVYRCPAPAVVVDPSKEKEFDRLIEKDQLTRYQKKLQKQGTLRYRHFEQREEALEHLESFFEQHMSRWAMSQERSQFLDPESRAFYRALVEECDLRNQLRFGVLELNSKPIAYHFGFEHNGTLTWYKPAFDVNYWDYCPGNVLLRGLLQHVRAEQLSELDFTLGDEPFKYRFANEIRQVYIVYVERRPERIESRVRSAFRSAQHAVRQRPELKSALKSGLHQVRQAAGRALKLTRGDVAFQACRDVVAGAFRAVWSVDEILLWGGFSRSQEGSSNVSIVPGQLADIARLSVEFGYFLSAAQLQHYRRLLKQGDRVFIARTASHATYVLWLGHRNAIEVSRRHASLKLELAEPLMVLGECWKAPDVHVRYVPTQVLTALAAHLKGRQIWICHVGRRGSLKEAIDGARAEIRQRLVCHTFLSSFRRFWLDAPSGHDPTLNKHIVKRVVRANS
jgi:CelD/BcsL family acetyltransferase involved in cellulose biosynthesis